MGFPEECIREPIFRLRSDKMKMGIFVLLFASRNNYADALFCHSGEVCRGLLLQFDEYVHE